MIGLELWLAKTGAVSDGVKARKERERIICDECKFRGYFYNGKPTNIGLLILTFRLN